MQTLKTDTRKRILAVSRKLFLEKGFQGATTREIAASSGGTLSNLYHYYPSKDELFCVLVRPATDALEGLLAERHGQTGYDIAKIQEEGYAAEELDEYMGIIRKHKDSLKMLLFKAQGSSLEGFKEYYVEKATRSVLDWFKLMKAVIDNVPVLVVVLILTIPIAILAMRLAEKALKKPAASFR